MQNLEDHEGPDDGISSFHKEGDDFHENPTARVRSVQDVPELKDFKWSWSPEYT